MAACAAVLIMAAMGDAAAKRGNSVHLFGSTEIKSSNLKPFPKWTGTLNRYFSEKKLVDKPCTSTIFNQCNLKNWQKLIAGVRHMDRRNQIMLINNYLNKAKYILDLINYRVEDYWATPLQFFSRDGDCEDYAIAKFMSMRALGVPNKDMRIVVLKDLNLRLAHAILVVYVDGEPLVLDNQINQVVRAKDIRHYQPIYSINETNWWLHRRG
ncbi:MAG: transglutaminase-like cysteine peptidase [Alphaproteobacteria bacterium]